MNLLLLIGNPTGAVNLTTAYKVGELGEIALLALEKGLIPPAEVRLFQPKLLWEVLGEPPPFQIGLIVLPFEPAFVGTGLGGDNLLVPIAWRTQQPLEVNLWHVAHEITEGALLFRQPSLPRWTKEGIAQLGAYLFFKRGYPHLLPKAEEHYFTKGFSDVEAFLSWLDLTKMLDPSDPFASIAAWSLGDHKSPLERQRYATALWIFRNLYGEEPDLKRAIEDIQALGPEGLAEKIRTCPLPSSRS
jgi:hypothetical protein